MADINSTLDGNILNMGFNRPLWDGEAYKELNSYRGYNPIGLIVEPVGTGPAPGKDEKGKTQSKSIEDTNYTEYLPFPQKKGESLEGRHSLFSAVNGVGNNLEYQLAMNVPLLDTPEMREYIRQRSDCSVKALVDASARGEMGRAIYTYADFMFCKHLGRISNNYLITLRRFPSPAGDHINYTIPSKEAGHNDHFPDIGRLVTWMGTPGNDMSAILKYDINLPYKEMNAEVQEAQYNADNSGGFLGGMMSIASQSYRNDTIAGKSGNNGLAFIRDASKPFGLGGFTSWLKGPHDNSWAYHRDAQKSYGPVDAITSTHYRQGAADGGIKFEHSITLTFDYELRSFDGINTRAALLDLLANILAVTFTNAQYWGGAVRGQGAAQSNEFANLPIFNMKEPLSFSSITDAVFGSLEGILQSFGGDLSLGGMIKAAGNLLKGGASMMLGGALNAMGRPQKNALNSLLNFAPTGLWHLMIGNPKHPIMSMGNMFLENTSIEHYGPLGLDDFPTGLKVTITLKHGMPRDNLKIEQMYMNGDWRIYSPLGDTTYDAWVNATEIHENESSQDTYNVPEAFSRALVPVDTASTEEASIHQTSSNKLLMKYFGTVNKQQIVMSGKEAYLGYQKANKDDVASQATRDKKNSSTRSTQNQSSKK